MAGRGRAILAAMAIGHIGTAAAGDLGPDDPAPLLALVRDVCVAPKHDLDQAIEAAMRSMTLKALGRQKIDDVGKDAVSWDASGDSSRFGVFYLVIVAAGGDLAKALKAHAVGDVAAFERGLGALPGVTLSPRKADEFSNPSLKAWSLNGGSADGRVTLELSSQSMMIDRIETNGYSITCAHRAAP